MIGTVARTICKSQGLGLAKQGLVKMTVRTHKNRTGNVIISPPRTKVPLATRVFTFVFFSAGVLATPAWVLTHLNEYRGGPAEQH